MSDVLKKIRETKEVRASIAYTIGGYLLKGLGFVTIPIFARLLSTSDFGVYNTFLSYEAILYLLICYALHVSIKNARYDIGMDRLDAYISDISILPIVTAFVCLVIVNLFSETIGNALEMDRLTLNLLVVYSYCTGLIILFQNRLVIEYKYKRYLQLTYFNALGSIVISICLILFVFQKKPYMGRIIGTVVPPIIISTLILYSFYKKNRPHINLMYLRYGLRIGIPVIPHGLGQIIMASFDRIMITNIVGAAESGIYSFSYTIFTMLQVASNALFSVFEPWAYEQLETKKNDKLRKTSSAFFGFMCVVALSVIVVSPEMIMLLGGEKYSEAIYTTIPVIVGGLFSLTYGIPAIIAYYYKKTAYISLGTIGASFINILMNFIFIHKYGYIAAAYTTLVSYALYYLFHSIISYRIAGFTIIPIRMLVIGFSFVGLGAVVTFLTLDYIILRYLILLTVAVVSVLIALKRKNDIIGILKSKRQ